MSLPLVNQGALAGFLESLGNSENPRNHGNDGIDVPQLAAEPMVLDATGPLLNATCDSLCHDIEGWGPISERYADFTKCFLDGVLLPTVNALFIVLAALEARKIVKSKGIAYRKNWIYYARQLVSVFQLVLTTLLIREVALSGDSLLDVSFLEPVLQVLALVVGLYVQHLDYKYSKVTASVILLYWFFSAFFFLWKSLNQLWRAEYDDRFIISIFLTINSTFALLICWIPQKPKTYHPVEKENPFDHADVFSRITFSWMTPLMKLGYKQFLTEDDLPALPKEFKSGYISGEFEKQWQKQLKNSDPSLAWAVLHTFGRRIIIGMSFKTLQDILQFSQPQLLKLLIRFVNDYNSGAPVSISKGIMLVLWMFVISITQTALLHQYFWNIFNTGMNVKSSLIATIYRKALRLSSEAKGEKATGDIVNLMAVDSQRLSDLSNTGAIIFSGPFQIVLCLYSLHGLLGNSMWVGVAVMLVLIPVNSLITKYIRALQKRQMKSKDERSRVIGEILNNIKSLKLYGWEKPYKAKLNYVRNEKELKNLAKMSRVQAFMSAQWSMAPFLVSCSTFAVYIWWESKPLTTDLVFPALTLFNLLSFPLAVLPMAITAFIEAQVAIGRLSSFLSSEELQPDAVTFLEKAKKNGDISLEIKDGTFLWSRKPEYKVALDHVNFTAAKGDLTCIVGRVGSGKSALVQSMLGNLNRINGSVTIHGHIAYVAQVPWIMNGTVKENIVFGHKWDPAFYDKTVKACALTVDFSVLKDGDETVVGEKGISLSGGQKARISLARAVYSRADVYLFDDPLAAVDEHVAKHLVDKVLSKTGLLGSKCKVLATNKISVLSIADRITLLEDGAITEQGSYDEVMSASSSALSKLITEYGSKKSETPEVKEEEIDVENLISSEESSELESTDLLSLRRASDATLRPIRFGGVEDIKNDRREHREQGKVKWDVYWDYIMACNPVYCLICVVMLIVPQGLAVVGSIWLKHWSEVNTDVGYNPHAWGYLGIYFFIGLLGALATMIQSIVLWQYCSIEGSKKLHSDMVDSVMRAPMQFFETTPIGRILNRFSSDIYKIDEILARTFSNFASNSFKVGFTIIVICYSTWQFIFIIIPLMFVYMVYQQYYMRSSRELRRLDSVTRSPVFAHFQETLSGTATIRGFGQQDRFEFMNQSHVDNNMSAYFPTVNTNRWLAVRLEFIGSLIILGAAGLSIFTLRYGQITAGLVGLSVSYSLQITQSLNWIVRMTVEVETNIVAVERVKEYSKLKPEAPEVVEPRPDPQWPQKGEIVFKNYSTRYREGLDLVLKNINLTIKPQEKIGIVGRTGAGKSSLTLALYRIIEPVAGEIIIDGVSTSSIGLEDLRHKLSIIPQDSQVFEGTLRENIDPTNQFTDEQIWGALEQSHLKPHILAMSSSNEGLEVRLSEGGSNLSVGQRQLMCLARALLIPSSILVLDEATAAVDVETDEIVQQTIRQEFKNRTILTIAHRLNTIMDSDRIVVLDNGEVAEFDTPENLLNKKAGLFYSLVNANEQL